MSSVSGGAGAAQDQSRDVRAGPGHAHLKRPLVNPLKLRTDAAAYPNGPLCAAAEIFGDNPADAGASHVSIDVLPAVVRAHFDTGPRLRGVDDGCSMSAAQLHHAVSHGFTTRKKGRYGMVRPRLHARLAAPVAVRRNARGAMTATDASEAAWGVCATF